MSWRTWFLGIILMSSFQSQAQVDAALQAALTYRFVQFTEWDNSEPKVYCVAGDQDVFLALKKLVSVTDEVKIINNYPQAKACNILFIGREVNLAEGWQQPFKDVGLLTIAANSEIFNQGAIFGLIVEPKQIAFRVNLTIAKERGYRLNARMLKLAKEIH